MVFDKTSTPLFSWPLRTGLTVQLSSLVSWGSCYLWRFGIKIENNTMSFLLFSYQINFWFWRIKYFSDKCNNLWVKTSGDFVQKRGLVNSIFFFFLVLCLFCFVFCFSISTFIRKISFLLPLHICSLELLRHPWVPLKRCFPPTNSSSVNTNTLPVFQISFEMSTIPP